LGIVYFYQGNLEAAIRENQRAIELDPEFGLAYHNLALAFFQKGDYKSAIFNLDKAIELGFPVNPELKNKLEVYRNHNICE
jgi:tetratricopeptide (TPR) repeat protein